MSDARRGDEGLRAYEVVERLRAGILRRMSDRAEGNVGALGQLLQRHQLRAHIGGAMAVEMFAVPM